MTVGGSTRWTPERRALALAMWADGRSSGEIAQRFGVSRSAVAGMVNRAGMVRGIESRRAPHDPCARFGDGDLLAALRLQRDGKSVSAIARRLGCKWPTARAVLARLEADWRESCA